MRAPEASLTTPLIVPPATCPRQTIELKVLRSKTRAIEANLPSLKCIRTPHNREDPDSISRKNQTGRSNAGKRPEEAVNANTNSAKAAGGAECTHEARNLTLSVRLHLFPSYGSTALARSLMPRRTFVSCAGKRRFITNYGNEDCIKPT